MIVSPPIIVLGTARSGSSLTAGLLHRHGVWVGECRPADEKNPKGYFENPGLKALRIYGPVDFKTAQHILERQGYRGGPWLVKHGPQHWENWLRMHPRFVLCRRERRFSVDSWMRHDKIGKHRAQEIKVKRDNRMMDEVREKHGGLDFRPGSLAKGYSELYELFDKLGIESDDEIIDDFYDPSLWSGG